MKIRDLIDAFEVIAPARLAEPWDNTGLILGTPDDPIAGPVLLTIDLTDAVLAEARSARATTLVCYHPPIFDPLRRITDADRSGRVLLAATRAHLSVYSPHTALDAAPGGMADWLADQVLAGRAQEWRRPILPRAGTSGQWVKVVTFVPAAAANGVRAALAGAGAGVIGDYTQCSFSSAGTGTFLGGAGASPAIGQAGRLESAPELRLEMICPATQVEAAMAALRSAHPYEEPAVDLVPLLTPAEPGVGAGRLVRLREPAPACEIAAVVARLAGPGSPVLASGDAARPVSVVGVCPGSGGSLVGAAAAAGCELFITGEMKHHEVLAADGVSILLAGHTQTERGYLPHLSTLLAERLPSGQFIVSQADAPPLRAC